MTDFMPLITYVVVLVAGALLGAGVVSVINFFRAYGRLGRLFIPTKAGVSAEDEERFIKHVLSLGVPEKLYLMRAMLGASYKAVIGVNSGGITIESVGTQEEDDGVDLGDAS